MQTARLAVLVAAAWLIANPLAVAQDARQRQAAAEAYDQGTSAYLSGDYVKAAEWFETANRLAPAAPALIQAARSLQQAGQPARAATVALRLTTEYSNEPAAVEFGEGLLQQLAGQLLRIDVSCEGCSLDVNGTLQEWPSFFVAPDEAHVVTASFETGDRRAEVGGQAGEVKSLEFEAPPPQATVPQDGDPNDTGSSSWPEPKSDREAKPLAPVFTFVGAGLTAALLAGSIVSTIDMNSGVDPYEEAAENFRMMCGPNVEMPPGNCPDLHEAAQDMLDEGRDKETRTTVLWVATGVVAAATTLVAVLLTNWDGGSDEKAAAARAPIGVAVAPGPREAALVVKGTF